MLQKPVWVSVCVCVGGGGIKKIENTILLSLPIYSKSDLFVFKSFDHGLKNNTKKSKWIIYLTWKKQGLLHEIFTK